MMERVWGSEARRGRALAPLAALALAACAASVVPPGTPATTSRYVPQGKPDPLGVIGGDARALTRMFGTPRLDIRDPTVRKLQFTDGQCVLDAYLYAPRARKEPVTTYAEARTADGAAMDWTACALRLKRH